MRRQFLRFAQGMFRSFITCFLNYSESLPFAMPVEMPTTWITDDQQFLQQNPTLRAIILFDVKFEKSELHIKHVRTLVPDVVYCQFFEAMQSQLALTDLRTLDPRLAGFKEAVLVSFDVGISWVESDRMNIKMENI